MTHYYCIHTDFCCSSASLFCCTRTTRYSSHCFWNCATLTLASSSSIDMASTFSLVSSILNRPFFSLSRESPNSFFLSNSNLCYKHNKRMCLKTGEVTKVYMWQPYLKRTMSTCSSVTCFSCMILLMILILTYNLYCGIGLRFVSGHKLQVVSRSHIIVSL